MPTDRKRFRLLAGTITNRRHRYDAAELRNAMGLVAPSTHADTRCCPRRRSSSIAAAPSWPRSSNVVTISRSRALSEPRISHPSKPIRLAIRFWMTSTPFLPSLKAICLSATDSLRGFGAASASTGLPAETGIDDDDASSEGSDEGSSEGLHRIAVRHGDRAGCGMVTGALRHG